MKWQEHIKISRSTGTGTQDIHRFNNGYGASVVNGPLSYGGDQGLYELAVLKFWGTGDYQFEICYDTPITGDVIGHLKEDQINDILQEISRL